MAEPGKLLHTLKTGSRFRAAVITTYNVWFPFFESVVLQRLRSAGCQHIVLLVDAGCLADALNDPDARPRRAGTLYSLLPVSASGAFHPKILLQVGETQGRVWVGSHNTTLAGFNQNLEVTTAASTAKSDDEARALAHQAWDAIREWMPRSGLADQARDAVERLAPWLQGDPAPATEHDAALLASSPARKPLWEQLQPWLPEDIRRVSLVGPYFDARLTFLHTLAERGAAADIHVGVIAGEAQFPRKQRSTLPARVRVVDATVLRSKPDEKEKGRRSRFVHAKALRFDGPEHSVIVAGSANPSSPAWLEHDQPNIEAIVVRRVGLRSKPLGLHRLTEAPPLSEEAWATLPERITWSGGSGAAPAVRIGILSGTRLLLDLGGLMGDRLVFEDEHGEDLGVRAASDVVEGAVDVPSDIHPSAIRLVRFEDGDTPTARFTIHHARALRRLARTGAELRLTEALQSLESENPDLKSVLSLLDPLLDADVKPRRPSGGGGKQGGQSRSSFGSGGAQAASEEDDGSEEYGVEGDLAEVMLYLHRRIGVAGQVTDRSEEDLVDSDDDVLLERKVYVPDVDERERIRRRMKSLVRKFSNRLTEASPDGAHDRMVKLAALLGLVHATRVLQGGRARHEHLLLAPDAVAKTLLHDGVAAALVRNDLRRAADTVGPDAAELRHIPPLLAWLLWDLGHVLPGRPVRDPMRLGRRVDEVDLLRRALWVGVVLQLDEEHWKQAEVHIERANGEEGGPAWVRNARACASHLRSLLAAPNGVPGMPQPGDLAVVGRGEYARLGVVYKDAGGSRQGRKVLLAEPEVGGALGTQKWPGATSLGPDAWVAP